MAICMKNQREVVVYQGRCICTRESTNPFATRPCEYMEATVATAVANTDEKSKKEQLDTLVVRGSHPQS